MGIDNFSFSNKNLETRNHDGPPAVICNCGLAWSNHTIRGRRECRLECVREETEEDQQPLHGVC